MKIPILIMLLSFFTFEGIQSKMENRLIQGSEEKEVAENRIVDSTENVNENDGYIYLENQQSETAINSKQDTINNQKRYIDDSFQCKGVNIILS